jgi:hypothetical protein
MNWRGRPLTDYQVVIETIAATMTETGLTVLAVLDEGACPTGVRITKAQMKRDSVAASRVPRGVELPPPSWTDPGNRTKQPIDLESTD